MNHNEFVARCNEVHSNKYTYPERYLRPVQRIAIECPYHGQFVKSAVLHLNGIGCAACKKEKGVLAKYATKEQFIKRAINVHGNKYDYESADYIDNLATINIYCNTCDYYFRCTRFDHITHKHGCPKCSEKKSLHLSYHKITYITELKLVNIRCDSCENELNLSPEEYFGNHLHLNCCKL